MEFVLGVPILTDADCTAAFRGRLDAVLLGAAGYTAMLLLMAGDLIWRRGNDGDRKATAIMLVFFTIVTCVLAGAAYIGIFAAEGRRQTLAEEGIRGLSLEGDRLVARYCSGRNARTASFPVASTSGWAYYIQTNRSETSIRLRFRLAHPDGRSERPEYKALVRTFRADFTALARLSPEVASGIAELLRTHPERAWR